MLAVTLVGHVLQCDLSLIGVKLWVHHDADCIVRGALVMIVPGWGSHLVST